MSSANKVVAELRTQLAAKDKELKLLRQQVKKPVSTSLILDPIAMTQFSLDNDCYYRNSLSPSSLGPGLDMYALHFRRG